MVNHECVFWRDGWDCRRKRALIRIFIVCCQWISLGSDTLVFCCSSTLNLSFKLFQNLTDEPTLFSGTWIWSIIVQYFQKYCFFSLLSSFIGLSFPTVYSICWFHFFVDFCDNWLCQEIKSFRSTQFLSIFFIKTFLNLNRKRMCMHWKKVFRLSDKNVFYCEYLT